MLLNGLFGACPEENVEAKSNEGGLLAPPNDKDVPF